MRHHATTATAGTVPKVERDGTQIQLWVFEKLAAIGTILPVE